VARKKVRTDTSTRFFGKDTKVGLRVVSMAKRKRWQGLSLLFDEEAAVF
jgi:hypothetical protein